MTLIITVILIFIIILLIISATLSALDILPIPLLAIIIPGILMFLAIPAFLVLKSCKIGGQNSEICIKSIENAFNEANFGYKNEAATRAAIKCMTGAEFPESVPPDHSAIKKGTAVASPEWLINENGDYMSLDGYNPDLQVGFEYQGKGHYEMINTAFDYIKGRKNDELKRILCEKNGVKLIFIPHTVSKNKDFYMLRDYIYTQLVKANRKLVKSSIQKYLEEKRIKDDKEPRMAHEDKVKEIGAIAYNAVQKLQNLRKMGIRPFDRANQNIAEVRQYIAAEQQVQYKMDAFVKSNTAAPAPMKKLNLQPPPPQPTQQYVSVIKPSAPSPSQPTQQYVPVIKPSTPTPPQPKLAKKGPQAWRPKNT